MKILVLSALALAPLTASAGGTFDGLTYTDCASGGPTAADALIAAQLSPQIDTPRNNGIDAGQVSCARTILATAEGRGLGTRGAVIAITTALAETELHDYITTAATEGSSLGLYQQIKGWGTVAERTNAVWSTNAFLNAMVADYPNSSWQTGDIGAICQHVQQSDVPGAYDPEAGAAELIVNALGTSPPDTSSAGNVISNGDFNRDASGWLRTGASTHYVRYASGAGGSSAYEGAGYLAANTGEAGGSVYRDTVVDVAAGDTYCVSAHLVSTGSGAGGGGTLALWFLGEGAAESSTKVVRDLPGASAWTSAQTCATATRAHSTIRVQVYPTAETIGIDAVALNRNLLAHGDFNTGAAAWSRSGATTNIVRQTGTAAYEGAGYLATNTATTGGSIQTDIPASIEAGDSYCLSAEMTVAATAGHATLALWLIGDTTADGGSKAVTGLAHGVWEPVQTCVTATHAHTAIRVQFFLAVGAPTLWIDALDLTHDLVPNGGFNASDAGWTRVGATTNIARYTSGAYEGAGFLATNATAGGSIESTIPLAIHTGESYCVSAQLTTMGTGHAGGGSFALWMLGGGSNENSSKAISALPGSGVWTPVETCVTATGPHTSLRVQFYPTPGATVGIDAVSID